MEMKQVVSIKISPRVRMIVDGGAESFSEMFLYLDSSQSGLFLIRAIFEIFKIATKNPPSLHAIPQCVLLIRRGTTGSQGGKKLRISKEKCNKCNHYSV